MSSSNALQRAARELAADLERYDIKVLGHQRRIVWRGIDRKVDFGTPKRECLVTLRRFIKAAKALERGEQLEKQTLLDV